MLKIVIEAKRSNFSTVFTQLKNVESKPSVAMKRMDNLLLILINVNK